MTGSMYQLLRFKIDTAIHALELKVDCPTQGVEAIVPGIMKPTKFLCTLRDRFNRIFRVDA
ncbi:hypothetical protein [Sphingobacterium sp. Mn56C]|uniref:hypothetical protein n=1 Tax=Sphingobacterium sp. Mn56C TaxID=3395261 RepID=UPI003BF51144